MVDVCLSYSLVTNNGKSTLFSAAEIHVRANKRYTCDARGVISGFMCFHILERAGGVNRCAQVFSQVDRSCSNNGALLRFALLAIAIVLSSALLSLFYAHAINVINVINVLYSEFYELSFVIVSEQNV